MPDKPFFSIITTCFNSEKTIEDTIESVLSQSFKDFEYIIVDACSKDSTLSKIKKYEDLFNGKLLCISEPDNGIYDGMNKGIKSAKGKYISILNSDDYYDINTLETVYNLASEKEKLPIIIGDICRVSEKKEEIYRHHFGIERVNRRIPFGHPSMFIPKWIYNLVGGYDYKKYPLAADLDFQQRLYKNSSNYDWIISEHTFTYMRTGGATDKIRNCKEWIKQKAKIDVEYFNTNKSIAYIKAIVSVYARLLKNLMPYKLQRSIYDVYSNSLD